MTKTQYYITVVKPLIKRIKVEIIYNLTMREEEKKNRMYSMITKSNYKRLLNKKTIDKLLKAIEKSTSGCGLTKYRRQIKELENESNPDQKRIKSLNEQLNKYKSVKHQTKHIKSLEDRLKEQIKILEEMRNHKIKEIRRKYNEQDNMNIQKRQEAIDKDLIQVIEEYKKANSLTFHYTIVTVI